MFLISDPRQIQNNLKQELRTKKKQKNEKTKQNNNRWQQKWRPIRAVHIGSSLSLEVSEFTCFNRTVSINGDNPL